MKQADYEEKVQKLLNDYQNKKVELLHSLATDDEKQKAQFCIELFEIMDKLDELLIEEGEIIKPIKQPVLRERLQEYRKKSDYFDKLLYEVWLNYKEEKEDFIVVDTLFVSPEEFNRRKRKFNVLFAKRKLPRRLKTLVEEHRKVFVSGAYNASIALCRVTLEVALWNWLQDKFPGNVEPHPSFNSLKKQLKNPKIKKHASLRKDLENKLDEIHEVANTLLHCKPRRYKKYKHNEDEALSFIHATFEILETLYK